jgi:hypothetical protein
MEIKKKASVINAKENIVITVGSPIRGRKPMDIA